MAGNNITITEEKRKVRAHWGKTEADIENDLEIIKEWLKTQKHLPETPNDTMIEFFLTNCKFSIEKVKENIDMYYSIRTLFPEFFSNPKLPELKRMWDYASICPLPNLTENLYKIVVIQFKDADPEKFDVNKWFAQFINIFEIRMMEESSLGYCIICDLKEFKIGYGVKFTPMAIKKTLFINESVGKGRLKQVHIINVPSYAHRIISVIKSLMKKKLADRVFVHTSYDTLFEQLPKNMLPSDYGGNQNSLDEICDYWKGKLVTNQDRFDLLDTFKVNESLRPEPLNNSELLGYYGNFKKIDID